MNVAQTAASQKVLSASAVAGFATELYREGKLWPVVKFMLTSAGWIGAGIVLAKIIQTIALPEAEVAEMLAGFTTWSAQTVIDAITLMNTPQH